MESTRRREQTMTFTLDQPATRGIARRPLDADFYASRTA